MGTAGWAAAVKFQVAVKPRTENVYSPCAVNYKQIWCSLVSMTCETVKIHCVVICVCNSTVYQ